MKKITTILVLVCFMTIPIFHLQAQETKPDEVLGTWTTIDDETGRKKSVVKLFLKGDKLYGKVIQLFRLPDEDPNPVCDECDKDDPRYNQDVIGMEIIKDMKSDGNIWDDGTILDPENGKIYSCKIWLQDGDLQVRGYLGFSFIGRSQTWIK